MIVAHCEAPACGHLAGEMVVITPYGDPVVCDAHAATVAAVWPVTGEIPRRSVSDMLKVMWLTPAMRFGPREHADRVAWLEGRPLPLEPRARLERAA